MKITREWINEEIALAERNLKYIDELPEDTDFDKEMFKNYYEGELSAYINVLFRKTESGRTYKPLDKSISKWKRKVIIFLRKVIDWLEGVEMSELKTKKYRCRK